MIGVFVIGAIIGCVCCCYCIKRHVSNGNRLPVQTVRAYDVTTTNQPKQTVVAMEPYKQPSSSVFTGNTNAPPPYCETKENFDREKIDELLEIRQYFPPSKFCAVR